MKKFRVFLREHSMNRNNFEKKKIISLTIVYRNIWSGNTYHDFCYSVYMLNLRSREHKVTMHNTVLLDVWCNMLIKFSKQIPFSFEKIINGYRGKFIIVSNIRDRLFSASRYWLHRRTQNLPKHLRSNFLQR